MLTWLYVFLGLLDAYFKHATWKSLLKYCLDENAFKARLVFVQTQLWLNLNLMQQLNLVLKIAKTFYVIKFCHLLRFDF